MSAVPTPEKGKSHIESSPEKHLAVVQPEKFQGLLDTIALLDKVSETMGDGVGENWSGGTGGAMVTSGSTGDQSAQSARAQAIAAIPDTPQMRRELGEYIQKEIKVLRKEVRKATFRMYKPGSAYALNELYGKIRRLNSLFAELMEASVDVLKRLFIKIFIDKQKVIWSEDVRR